MKRGITVLICLCAVTGALYFAISKWGIRHETLNLFDTARQRPVVVDLAVRWDYQIKADDGYWKLPIAVISNGNTVKNTEYSFLANVFAARGYLVASIQQDLPTDPPLMTNVGQPYVGRREVYEKGEANILFVLQRLKELQPHADHDRLTLVGHSNGGDTAMYFAQKHPDLVSKVVTLDNLRVPFVLSDKLKILSFRSKDPNFVTDPGVLPSAQDAKAGGINIVQTQFQHTWMSDRGPDSAKERIQATLDEFLGNGSASELAPVDNNNLIVTNTGTPLP
jgi:dienelactone hydrolase